MDLYDDEILRLWQAFEQNQLEYMMVGGFATNLHGFNRFTSDLDIWIKDNLANRKALIKSLEEIGLPHHGVLETTQLIPGWTSIALPSGFELDIMTYIQGFQQADFDQCSEYASEVKIASTKIKFLHINHLIQAKEASNRPKDQIDLIELRKLRDKKG
jgi:hypothetical protein